MSSALESQLQNIKDEIARILSSARSESGYDQVSVEREAQIAHGTLSKFERGVSEALPSLELAARLERALSIPSGDLRPFIIAGRIVRNFRRDEVSVGEILGACDIIRKG